jgi:hypothetical protein
MRPLPTHLACGTRGLGEPDAEGVLVCTVRRNWSGDGARDELGCGARFPLCESHGLRGCISCHRGEPPPAARDRLRALVVRAWRASHLEHRLAQVYLDELDAAKPVQLRAMMAALAPRVAGVELLERAACCRSPFLVIPRSLHLG